MKKLLLIAMAVLSLNAFALSVNVGASYQEAAYTCDTGIFDAISGSGKVDYDDPILAVNVEVTQGLVIGEIGAGASYEQGYKDGSESFDAIPVYGLLKVNLFPIGIKPYLTAKYGTTFYVNEKNVDMKGGQNLSIGAGITLVDTLQLEGTLNASKAEKNGVDIVSGSYGLTLRYNTF